MALIPRSGFCYLSIVDVFLQAALHEEHAKHPEPSLGRQSRLSVFGGEGNLALGGR